MLQLLALGFHGCVCSLSVDLFLKLKLACKVGDCMFSVASSLHLQHAPGGQVCLVICPVQLWQLSSLGTQLLGAGALSEDVWVLQVASPGGGQAWGHSPEYVAVVLLSSASLTANEIHVF